MKKRRCDAPRELTGPRPGAKVRLTRYQEVGNTTNAGDLELLWDLFERTGSVEAYLLFHEAKKNTVMLERAKSAVDEMKREFETN